MERQYFNTNNEFYEQPAKINIDKNCNALTIKNLGNGVCYIDDEPLLPLESKVIAGNENQIYYGRHEIKFGPLILPLVQPIPEIDWAVVTQKFFIESPKKGC